MNCFNKYKTPFLLVIVVFSALTMFGQKQRYLPIVVGFYNLENLYDTTHNAEIDDIDFSINGRKNYTSNLYQEKIGHLAKVLRDIGSDIQKEGFAVLGVAELENDTILLDLIKHPLLRERNLRFVHFDSKDRRGVDVALLYNNRFFKVKSANTLFVAIPSASKTHGFTRDILHVEGELLGENVHIYVNHWPSRVGGEKKSYPARSAAAKTLRSHINTIKMHDSLAKIIVMGDMNDDPISKSIVLDLGSNTNRLSLDTLLFNPWVEKFKKGYGTLAYRNAWSLFDQILVSKEWLPSNNTLFYLNASIFKPDYLIEKNGNYKGYPKRTFVGDMYNGGYSDHFPVFVTFLKYLGIQ